MNMQLPIIYYEAKINFYKLKYTTKGSTLINHSIGSAGLFLLQRMYYKSVII